MNAHSMPDGKLAFTIQEAVAAGAGSRSALYEAMRRGDLPARKRGRCTIILRDDLERYLGALPEYQIAA